MGDWAGRSAESPEVGARHASPSPGAAPAGAVPPNPAPTGGRASRGVAAGELAALLPSFIPDWPYLGAISKTALPLLLGWISLRLRGIGWREVGLTRFRSWGATLAIGAAAGIGMECLELFATQPLLVRLTGRWPDLSKFAELRGNAGALLLVVVLAWTLAAFGEEMVYRGYLMNRVADLGHRPPAAWGAALGIISVLFGFAHRYQGVTGVVENGIDGLILGLLYLACGRNLAAPILAHGIGDTVDALLIFLGRYPGM